MRTVLIATQSDDVAYALTGQLEGKYTVHRCTGTTDAGALLESLHPDALVLDLHLPGGGLSRLTQAPYKPPVVVGLTRHLSEAVSEAAAEAGVSKLLLLPCTADAITRSLESAL